MTIALLKLCSESDEQRMVWGEVYVPNIPDTDGEFMTAESIQKMAYDFMRDLNLKNIDVQHSNELVEGCCVVESFIARKGDPDFIEGSWVVGVHIPDDDTWGKVKKGEINGFSMEAWVKKHKQVIEMEIPPVLSGKTSKAEDGHIHTFYVAYDETGRFLGGRTDEVDGHSHTIRKGTATDTVNDHNHRFSFVENLKANEVSE